MMGVCRRASHAPNTDEQLFFNIVLGIDKLSGSKQALDLREIGK